MVFYRYRRKKKRKRTENKNILGAFDWDRAITKEIKEDSTEFSVNSAFFPSLVLETVAQSPPGSGTGLIPLFLPRQEKAADQELINSKLCKEKRLFPAIIS